MNRKELINSLTRILKHAILLAYLLVTVILTTPNLANLSASGNQSLGCVTIKVQYQDGCPRPDAEVRVLWPFEAPFGTTNASGVVSVCGWLEPNQDYYVVAYWPDSNTVFTEWLFVTDEHGNADVTMIRNSDHPNTIIMNVTSPTNYVRFVENALSDSSTVKDVTFEENENKTVYIRLPEHSTVLNASLNLSGHVVIQYSDWDDTEDCFSFNGSVISAPLAVDENWGTFAYIPNGGAGNVNEAYNYPELERVRTIKWEVEAKAHGGGNEVYVWLWNYTGNTWLEAMHFTDTLGPHPQWKTVILDAEDFQPAGHTFNASTQFVSTGYTGWWVRYYEGHLSWGCAQYPTNSHLNVGSDEDIEWSYPGMFNESAGIHTTPDLSAEINEYLSKATPDAHNEVDVPIVLHSDNTGTIRISDIQITYLYNTTYLHDVDFVTPLVGYNVNRTAYYNSREVCIHGFFVNNNSVFAKVDGMQHPVRSYDGHKYVEFVELVPVGLALTWGNHTIWWDTLSTPIIELLSPENRTYNTNSVDLNFTVNEPTTWIGYSIDEQEFQTVSGNTTLNITDGMHNIILNVTDGTGDPGTSERIHFIVSTHDVALTNVLSSSMEAIMGQIVNITVQAKNEGLYTETFNITTYYDEALIQTKEVPDLAPGEQANLTFNWNTIGIQTDVNYTIKAETSAVVNETDVIDNTLIDGTIIIRTERIAEVAPCDQVGNPKETFEISAIAYFKVKVNNTCPGVADVLVTTNVYDSDNMTIGVASFQGSIAPGVSALIIGVPIPTSARLGTATVYANAYTDWPHKGGVPYCPEVSATFQIVEGA